MNDAIILVFGCAIVLAGALGYLLGRHEAHLYTLTNRIRTLTEGQARLEAAATKPEPQKPTVTAGVYTPEQPFTVAKDSRTAGLVEAKTPQQLAWQERVEEDKLEKGQV